MPTKPLESPHRRFNPLTGEWLLVSPHRTQRPWLGQVEKTPPQNLPAYDPSCYLCPGNSRAGGKQNLPYTSTYVFENDFPALLPGAAAADEPQPELLVSRSVTGTCRVVCFSPRHDLTLAEMPVEDIRRVIDAWAEQITDLGHTYRWVQVFENKGAVMGCSNPHPHGQIWALDALPEGPEKEDRQQRLYFSRHGSSLLVDYALLELERQERLVVENEDWVVVVPYWAVWPFETLLLPRQPIQRLPHLGDVQRRSLAEILKRLLDCLMPSGTIILLNGASSSGKTSILKALQDILEEPYVDAGLDKFLIEVDTSINNPEECARQVIARIRSGDPPTAFSRLKALQEVRHPY